MSMETANQAVEVIAVYAACLQGLKSLTDRIDAPRGTEALWQQMRIQASRLRVWGEQFNIDQDSDGVATLSTKEGVLAYEQLRDYLTDWPVVGKGILEALYGIVEFLVCRRKLEERFGLRFIKSNLKAVSRLSLPRDY